MSFHGPRPFQGRIGDTGLRIQMEDQVAKHGTSILHWAYVGVLGIIADIMVLDSLYHRGIGYFG